MYKYLYYKYFRAIFFYENPKYPINHETPDDKSKEIC